MPGILTDIIASIDLFIPLGIVLTIMVVLVIVSSQNSNFGASPWFGCLISAPLTDSAGALNLVKVGLNGGMKKLINSTSAMQA